MFVSVTRLRVRSLRYLLPFFWHSIMASRQAERASGFRGGKLAGDAKKTFWTVTGWDDEAAMRVYFGAGAHRRVMPKLLDWCDEASVVHWTQEGVGLPDMPEAHRRMVAEGRLSKVKHPSPSHASKQMAQIAAPEARFERMLRIVRKP